jgi:hypothetical protein
MILESHCWKQDLLRQAGALRRFEARRRWTQAASLKLEQIVLLGFYTIWKLIESNRLSPRVVQRPMELESFRPRPASQVPRPPRSIDDRYALDEMRPSTHDLLFVCHQMVHNHVFAPQLDDEHSLAGFYLTSAHQRKVGLYRIPLEDCIALFEEVAVDEYV